MIEVWRFLEYVRGGNGVPSNGSDDVDVDDDTANEKDDDEDNKDNGCYRGQ